MSGVAIVGTGGLGREAHEILEATGAGGFLGFLDDRPETHGQKLHDSEVLGPVRWLADHPEAEVVVAVGNPAVRARLVRRIAAWGPRRYATLLHPRAHVGRRVEIGEGSIVFAGASITTDARLGRHVVVNPLATLAHDCRLEDYVLVAPGASVSGNVVLAEGADVGTNAAILQGLKVGAWAIVGAGATVIADVPPDTTVVGTPARVIRERPRGWQDKVS